MYREHVQKNGVKRALSSGKRGASGIALTEVALGLLCIPISLTPVRV